MQDFGIKILLNHAICGNLPPLKERGFAPVPATNLQEPDYQSQFLETLPTMWATAHIFQHALARKDRATVEEWIALLLLHGYKRVHLDQFTQRELHQQYDRDLWPALSGTYPHPQRADLSELKILRTDDDLVVGASYPGVIFFPARSRAAWPEDPHLLDCLDDSGQQLSWARSSALLLQREDEQQRFYRRLYSITAKLEGPIRGALLEFLRQEPVFSQFRQPDQYDKLSDDPSDWPSLGEMVIAPHPSNHENEPSQLPHLLQSYPFKQTRNGGTTFYLLTGLPITADWMRSPVVSGGPAPNQYERVTNKQLRVRFGQDYTFNLGDKDEIVPLKDLFCVEASPYYCVLDKRVAEEQVGAIRRLHKQEIVNNTAFFTEVKPSDLAVCFAPIKSQFLGHFPEVLAEPERFLAVRGRTAEGGLEWEFNFFGQKLIWPTAPKPARALPNSSLCLWPPKVAPQWRLYVAHGTGAKRDSCGRWHLIGEAGQMGENFELAEDEYINVLNTPGQANRPRALALVDSAGKERGVLFMASLEEQAASDNTARLAVDFGTSNTSLAIKVVDRDAEPLLFNLSPKMLWGGHLGLENPGFVPFKWGGSKGYFSTILLKRQIPESLPELPQSPGRSAADGKRKTIHLDGLKGDQLEAQHFFAVDIPGLHAEMEGRVFDGSLKVTWPKIHKNMKWESDAKMPWRRPAFLGLALLYAHAELFFRFGAMIAPDRDDRSPYVFTFPLAFDKTERDGFETETEQVVNCIRQICFGASGVKPAYIDESTAIARSVQASPMPTTVDVFVDIGGGTTDIAIRHQSRFLLLDSVKLAGRSFFSFAERNFDMDFEPEGDIRFKQHLSRLLLNEESAEAMDEQVNRLKSMNLDLGTFYSLVINRLDNKGFKSKEATILEKGMGAPSYQGYRTRLFFRHTLAYALLQTCAAVVDHKLDARTLTSGIKLILSGNGWGLLLFGGFQRSEETLQAECKRILDLLKQRLLQSYDKEIAEAGEAWRTTMLQERACLENLKIADINLLNERDLSKAKTEVPVGALKVTGQSAKDRPKPYAGVTLPSVSINQLEPVPLRWCERWSEETLKNKADGNDLISFEVGAPANSEAPIDQALTVFTILGAPQSADPMPPKQWLKINGQICSGDKYLRDGKLEPSPINQFVSHILYPEDDQHVFLDALARINKTVK
jgi:hypothetical protein